MDKLHPGARWLFRLRTYYLLIFIGLFISIYSFQILRFFVGGSAGLGFVLAIIFYIFFVIIVAEIYARMGIVTSPLTLYSR